MVPFKEHIAKQLIGHHLKFKCECLFGLDVDGIVKGWEIVNNEIVFHIDSHGKIIKVGENHPNMYIEFIS